MQSSLTEQILDRTYQVINETLTIFLIEDPIFEELLGKLINSITQSLDSEVQLRQNIDKIEVLLGDLLEEIKLNYIQKLSQEDVEEVLEQTRILRQEIKALPQVRKQ